MKFAVVAISPTFGGKLVSVDEAKAKAVSGVSQVVRSTTRVAIVALHTGQPSKVSLPRLRSGTQDRTRSSPRPTSLRSSPLRRKSPVRSRVMTATLQQ